jgi:Nucleotidyl transferase AbiEii toxin, Type IV TA system
LFEREHHRRIARVLAALDADKLAAHACLFGGGTAMALRYGEYRESVDIDFLVSNPHGYRQLRQSLTGPEGLSPIVRQGATLTLSREVRADQYGIRTMLRVDNVEIKFEVVLEGRIDLEPPGPQDSIEGIATLCPLDMAASKLLANSDRWADDAVASRDLIDLAMMQPSRELLERAVAKAAEAYGDTVTRDLVKAIAALRERPHRLEQCMKQMRMAGTSRALLWQRIKALQP